MNSGERSRAKGVAFETKVAKWFNDVLELPDKSIMRRPTNTPVPNWAIASGDLMVSRDVNRLLRFPFSVECKHFGSINIGNLLTAKGINAKILSAWKQCLRQKEEDEQRDQISPLLFVRLSGGITIVLREVMQRSHPACADLNRHLQSQQLFEVFFRQEIKPPTKRDKCQLLSLKITVLKM